MPQDHEVMGMNSAGCWAFLLSSPILFISHQCVLNQVPKLVQHHRFFIKEAKLGEPGLLVMLVRIKLFSQLSRYIFLKILSPACCDNWMVEEHCLVHYEITCCQKRMLSLWFISVNEVTVALIILNPKLLVLDRLN